MLYFYVMELNIESFTIIKNTINKEYFDDFINSHKSNFIIANNEMQIRRIVYECVIEDVKNGKYVVNQFNYSDNNEPYTLNANYMTKSINKQKYFVIESYIKNEEYIYITHECTIVAFNKSNCLVSYDDCDSMNTLLPKCNVFDISCKINLEAEIKELNKQREKALKLESELYNKYYV